ncbi:MULTISPECIES: helix-turn-helix domain-containing protein [Chryseobacterium]|uniref:Helix-turn-helix domain-containing protein n=2 Tax=Chryseobacterium TaxID=59732 RepID=A0A6N4X4G0_9FLAO|nr:MULTISPECIES: helix-turn-helix domain-containing protein [Chryseobacterium]RMZ59051.1 helix-turn-helix domain-containing protein [Chryseobacterium nematophagum]CAA7194926.1 hypothetical protein CHRY9293_01186 [Chryseobacterium potabilaquae]
MIKSTINYKLIFKDILDQKYPEKKELCKPLLSKESLSTMDIIDLNKRIFGAVDEDTESFNQSHKAYSQSSILYILDYQKKFKLNNSEAARHFKLSRYTLREWKKRYLI